MQEQLASSIAASLNSSAVHCLEEDHNEEAVTQLMQALSILQSDLSKPQNIDTKIPSGVGLVSVPLNAFFAGPVSVSPCPTSVGTSSDFMGTEEIVMPITRTVDLDSNCTFFARAFRTTNLASNNVADKEMLAAVMLYNLGLAFHRMGKRDATSHRHLDHALTFYGKALDVLIRPCMVSTPAAIKIYLAQCINTTDIHQQFFDAAAVNDLHYRFQLILSSPAAWDLSREELSTFTIIAWYSRLQSCLPSPAA